MKKQTNLNFVKCLIPINKRQRRALPFLFFFTNYVIFYIILKANFVRKGGKSLKKIIILLVLFAFFCCGASSPEKADHELMKIQYNAPASTTPEIAVINYFSALYRSYLTMLPMDLSPIIDLDFEMMGNVQNWNDLLAMRRSIIYEKGYCFVETEHLPYTINYFSKKDLDDQRMDYVRIKDFGEGAVALHFVINGIDGKAYPPIFALNSQHTIILTFEDGIYKVAYHYFPGSEGKFENDLPVETMEMEEMEKLLEEEFSSKAAMDEAEPEFERLYNGEAATEYALRFCEEHNPEFYFVGDWYGNCMNFSSQCIWSGFREEDEGAKYYEGMTKAWYCGKNGGSLPWASVSRFWKWVTSAKTDMQISVFNDVNAVKIGDIVHIGSYACEIPEKFTHALLVVDSEKLLLAQNSPACFVYYSDLANNFSRFIRPISLDA